jgi:hypothetical protein
MNVVCHDIRFPTLQNIPLPLINGTVQRDLRPHTFMHSYEVSVFRHQIQKLAKKYVFLYSLLDQGDPQPVLTHQTESRVD